MGTSSYSGEARGIFYGFGRARFLNSLISELLFCNESLYIPTHVRNDNEDALYQSRSNNTSNDEERLIRFLESSRE